MLVDDVAQDQIGQLYDERPKSGVLLDEQPLGIHAFAHRLILNGR
jgi:hypothetical protein